MVIKPKPGRPNRTMIEWFRNRLWFAAVSKTSGKKPFALDQEFSSSHAKPSCLWAKYARGTTGPSEQLVLRVNETYKNTANWYFHPLWKLAANRTSSPGELRSLIHMLEPRVKSYLIRESVKESDPFWFSVEFDPIMVLEAFVQQASIGSMAGIVAMIRFSEIQQNQLLYLAGHVALAHHTRASRDSDILRCLAPDFHVILIRRMLRVNFTEVKPVKLLEYMSKSSQSRTTQKEEELLNLVAAAQYARRDEVSILYVMGQTKLDLFSQ